MVESNHKKIDKIMEKVTKEGKISLLGLSDAEKTMFFDHLRKESRTEYIGDRVGKTIELTEAILRGEESMFRDMDLPEKERRIFENRKKELEIAKKIKSGMKDVQVYKMPESFEEDGQLDLKKKHKVLYERYNDIKPEENEHEAWENKQIRNAKLGKISQAEREEMAKKKLLEDCSMDFVKIDVMKELKDKMLRDKLRRKIKREKKREKKRLKRKGIQVSSSEDEDESNNTNSNYKFDDSKSLASIHSEQTADTLRESKRKLESVLDPRVKTQLERQTLPIYKYREDILKLIRDNQTVVLVGETGSGKTTQIP